MEFEVTSFQGFLIIFGVSALAGLALAVAGAYLAPLATKLISLPKAA
jgi:hypothetical protein